MKCLVLLIILPLAGCFATAVGDRTIDGAWRVVATDTNEDRILCRSMGDHVCSGDGLPDAMAIAVGWDTHYLTLAAHPKKDAFHADFTVTRYYYIVRQVDEASPRADIVVRGPFDQAQFARETAVRKLPPLVLKFEDGP